MARKTAKKGRGARNKGATFERQVAKQLTAWTGTTFSRTPMSGGWSKTGDVTPKDPKMMQHFPFSVECKKQECWSIMMLLTLSTFKNFAPVFRKWWKQCRDDAKKGKKKPLLVFTRNNCPVFLLMRKSDFEKMQLKRQWTTNLTFQLTRGKFILLLWDEFMAVPYEHVCHYLKVKG